MSEKNHQNRSFFSPPCAHNISLGKNNNNLIPNTLLPHKICEHRLRELTQKFTVTHFSTVNPCQHIETRRGHTHIRSPPWKGRFVLINHHFNKYSFIACSIFSGTAPTSTIGLPPTGMKNSVGKAFTLYILHNSFSLSASTFKKITWSLYFSANCSMNGSNFMQGPHHVAQKSITTGLSLLLTNSPPFR